MPSCRKATTRTWISPTEQAPRESAAAPMAYATGLPESGSVTGSAVRRWAVACGVVLVAALLHGSRPGAEEPGIRPDQVAIFMRAKLAHSQNVLEGLTVEDYELIDKGAQQLSLASEDASWQVLQTEDYARQSAEFRHSCDRLRKAARERNLDGAALAWMEVTMKCVPCHKYVRDEGGDDQR